MRSALSLFLRWLAILPLVASGCAPRQGTQPPSARAEARADLVYQANLHQGPEALRAFLADFPKGADLHMHLLGAVYAETFIRDAGEDGLCIDPVALSLTEPPCRGRLIPAKALSGDISPANQALYDKLIDSMSMRNYVPLSEWSGHAQFFAAFTKFEALGTSHIGEWVDEVAGRAAAQNQQYLELMETPPFRQAAQIAHALGWSPELAAGGPRAFARFRQELLDRGLGGEVAANRDEVREGEATRKRLEHCGATRAVAACSVETRYIYQVFRGFAPEQVFAQALLGFETVAASMEAKDDTWVAITFAMPEDGLISMRDYTLHMHMLDYLHSVYPQVHISQHAGELVEGLVPPEGLRFHIRQALELGHAERIGHGVDVMHEDDARGLLKELADQHIMIEINLSSNAEILGVEDCRHPFPVYRASHVPVALSTDDEGVSRIDLTHEFVRAALVYGLSYRDLKQLARTSMEHDFLPGVSLWAKPDDFRAPVKACSGQTLGGAALSADCTAFLARSQKASAQWELERRLTVFEGKVIEGRRFHKGSPDVSSGRTQRD
jgi:adenosine deaminase